MKKNCRKRSLLDVEMHVKRPTRCNRWFFIAKLTVRSTCFGHHYAHHQELMMGIVVPEKC